MLTGIVKIVKGSKIIYTCTVPGLATPPSSVVNSPSGRPNPVDGLTAKYDMMDGRTGRHDMITSRTNFEVGNLTKIFARCNESLFIQNTVGFVLSCNHSYLSGPN